jgi:hypothetical protein
MSNHNNPALWNKLKDKIMKGDKGGKAGQWSARKAQILVKSYVDNGGGFIGKKSKDNSLVKWTKQNWMTKSGLPSLVTGERYLPEKAIKALTSDEYNKTSDIKRHALELGHQFSAQPRSIINQIRRFYYE